MSIFRYLATAAGHAQCAYLTPTTDLCRRNTGKSRVHPGRGVFCKGLPTGIHHTIRQCGYRQWPGSRDQWQVEVGREESPENFSWEP